MAKLKIYNAIADEQDKIFLSDWFGIDSICYKDITDFLDSMDEDDNDIELLIHCQGGDCMEGWAIYDKLRTSGKNITATIEGMCASMASIILLAAPKERRFGFENASLLIHNPAVGGLDDFTGERLTADELSRLKGKLGAQEAALIEEQNKILDLYVERTGSDRNELQKLMDEDKFVKMDKAIELGFISSTVEPNTASASNHFNQKNMAKEEKVVIGSNFFKNLLSLAGFAKIEDVQCPLDQEITAVDGSVFTVEREDGDPQVGDRAYPDGKYTVEDGTTITIEGEVIKDITKEDEAKAEVVRLTAELDKANKQIDDLKSEKSTLEAKVEEQNQKITDLTSENDTLKAEKDSANEGKVSAEDELKKIKDENADLQSKVDALTSEKESLTASQKTDNEKAILDTVANAGGKEWLDNVCNLKSTFNPGNRQFTPRGESGKGMSKTQKLLAEKEAEFEAKRNK